MHVGIGGDEFPRGAYQGHQDQRCPSAAWSCGECTVWGRSGWTGTEAKTRPPGVGCHPSWKAWPLSEAPWAGHGATAIVSNLNYSLNLWFNLKPGWCRFRAWPRSSSWAPSNLGFSVTIRLSLAGRGSQPNIKHHTKCCDENELWPSLHQDTRAAEPGDQGQGGQWACQLCSGREPDNGNAKLQSICMQCIDPSWWDATAFADTLAVSESNTSCWFM